MKKIMLIITSLTLILSTGIASANHHKSEVEKQEAFLDKKCGEDQACREKLMAKMQESMKSLKQKCGDDKDCMKETRQQKNKVQQLRKKYEQRKESECGDDKKCKWKLQKEFKEKVKELKS